MQLTKEEAIRRVRSIVDDGYHLDNDNQIMFYTGVYLHSDGTYHDEPE